MTRIHRFSLLERKNFNLGVTLLDQVAWRRAVMADPRIPRNLAQLQSMWDDLTRHRRGGLLMGVHGFDAAVSRGLVARSHEECAEAAYARFYTGLGSPFLSQRDREAMEAIIAAATPMFDQMLETDHFILRWTNSSDHGGDNLADPQIVQETAGYLEAAWSKYTEVFDRAPHLASGATKVEVTFLDLGDSLGATLPNAPIKFNARRWQAEPGVRQPTSAHELFHRIQFAFGYRTTWTPVEPFKWFSEGMASWAEVYLWQRVSGAYKLNDLFTNPDVNLFDASYRALPFWLFFDTRQRDTPTDLPLLDFLSRYETSGDDKATLEEIIASEWPPNDVFGHLDSFFALFSRERRTGHWRQMPSGVEPYPSILGPDGVVLVPALTVTNVPLNAGDRYSVKDAVSGLGSDYYAFRFAGNADGRMLTVSITVESAGDFSCFLVWEKGGVMQRADFPVLGSISNSFYRPIELAQFDGLVFIVSGRGKGGCYEINVVIG